MRKRLLLILAGSLALPVGAAFGQASVATSFNNGTVNSGVSMVVHAAASADRRYVIMSLQQNLTTLDAIDTVSIPNTGVQTFNTINGAPINGVPPAGTTTSTGAIVFINRDPAPLATQAPAIKNSHMTIAHAVRTLAGATKTNLVLSPAALKLAGVDVNTPRVVNLPAQDLMHSLADLFLAASDKARIVATADENAVFITSQAQDDQHMVTRWYSLGTLLSNIPRYVPRGTNLNDVGGKGPLDVKELIEHTVRPAIWKDNGGKWADIDVVGSTVRVKAPESVQALLAGPTQALNPVDPRGSATAPLYIGYDSR